MNKLFLLLVTLFSFGLSAQTCESQLKSTEDLYLTDYLEASFNNTFPNANPGFVKNNFYYLVYKSADNNTVTFMGTGHAGLMDINTGSTINKHLIKVIKQLKSSQQIKTVIVERNDDEVLITKNYIDDKYCSDETCQGQDFVQISTTNNKDADATRTESSRPRAKKGPILYASEIDAAIWTANKENITIKGGEPLDDDFLKIFKRLSLSKVDYRYYEILQCLSERQNKFTAAWLAAYNDCTLKQPLSKYNDNKHRGNFEQWFKENSAQTPCPYVKTSDDCQSIEASNITLPAIFNSNGCYIIKLTELTNDELRSGTINKKSINYLFTMIQRIKNFCLLKNILTSLKNGNVFVVYGAAHIKDTYLALTKNICSATEAENTLAAAAPPLQTPAVDAIKCPKPKDEIL